MKRHLPPAFYNGMTYLGAALALAGVVVLFLVVLLDFLVHPTTMYLGLFTYLILPLVVVTGFALALGGAWRHHRRILAGEASSEPPLLVWDARNPRHRRLLWMGLGGTAVFLLASTLGTYKVYHVTESQEFCGLVCHTVMKPEYTAYQGSAHARVECVACHIGSGADWYVRSKFSGLRQLVRSVRGNYQRPIETPLRVLRPARDTCEKCHWPDKFYGDRLVTIPHYLADEKNTPAPVTMVLKTGGGHPQGGSGIHWHMSLANKVEYIARDSKRQEIAWVRLTRPGGERVEYQNVDSPLSPEERARGPLREMDCMDCHNRPSHRFGSPMAEVNAALARGALPTALPYLKREAVKALDAEYPDTATALASIRSALTSFYAAQYPGLERENPGAVQKAVEGVQNIYSRNFFPEMKASWRQYPEHIGHTLSAGCFRCHGDHMQTAEGKTIPKGCTLCHEFPSMGITRPTSDGIFRHPVDIGGVEQEGGCVSCHQGGAELY